MSPVFFIYSPPLNAIFFLLLHLDILQHNMPLTEISEVRKLYTEYFDDHTVTPYYYRRLHTHKGASPHRKRSQV